jgi:hypothetical protein
MIHSATGATSPRGELLRCTSALREWKAHWDGYGARRMVLEAGYMLWQGNDLRLKI